MKIFPVIVKRVAAASRAVARVTTGLRLSTVVDIIAAKIQAGVSITRTVIEMATLERVGVVLSTKNTGAASVSVAPGVRVSTANGPMTSAKPLHRAGARLSTRNSPMDPSKPLSRGAARITQTVITLNGVYGGEGVTEEAVGGRTDWANDVNANGKKDAVVASIAGGVGGARGGRLVLDFPAFPNKDGLIISQVRLVYYFRQFDTSLNNGSTKPQWRKVSTDGWTTLQTYAGNINRLVAGDVWVIIPTPTWSELGTIQAALEFDAALGETFKSELDAIHLEIDAEKVETT